MTIAIHCSRCGQSNFNYAQFCSGCGSALIWGTQPTQPAANNTRLYIAIALGVFGIVFCGFPSVIGAFLAYSELQSVKSGTSPQSNAGLAKIALWVNIAAFVISFFVMLMFFVPFILMM